MNESTLEAYDALTIEPRSESKWHAAAVEAWAEAGIDNSPDRRKAARLILKKRLRADRLDPDGLLSGESIRWSVIADRFLAAAVSEYQRK